MHKKGKRILACLLAAVMMVLPLTAMADPSEEGEVTQAMTRSERQIQNILAESDSAKQTQLFSDFVTSRLLYSTVRSLSGQEDSWLGYVDVYQRYLGGEPDGYVLQQCLVQYGMKSLPAETGTCTLKLGTFLHSMEFNKQAVFTFPNEDLGDDALTGGVSLSVRYKNTLKRIPLEQGYPDEANEESLSQEKALSAMAAAYSAYYEPENREPPLVDHTVMRLRSYVRDASTQTRSYIWELYLVHGSTLPSSCTVLRYNTYTETVTVACRTLREYF